MRGARDTRTTNNRNKWNNRHDHNNHTNQSDQNNRSHQNKQDRTTGTSRTRDRNQPKQTEQPAREERHKQPQQQTEQQKPTKEASENWPNRSQPAPLISQPLESNQRLILLLSTGVSPRSSMNTGKSGGVFHFFLTTHLTLNLVNAIKPKLRQWTWFVSSSKRCHPMNTRFPLKTKKKKEAKSKPPRERHQTPPMSNDTGPSHDNP
jgi:hypothetical protein